MVCKSFIAQPLEVLHHLAERLAVGWPRSSEHPCACGTTPAVKMPLFNPCQLAECFHHGTPRQVQVVRSLGHSLSLPAGLPWVCVEWTSEKNDSRILRIDTVESVGTPGWTQQFLSFLICGFGHSDSRDTKSTPQPSPRRARNTSQPLASVSGWTSSLTLPTPTITLRSRLVHPVNPAKSIRQTP